MDTFNNEEINWNQVDSDAVAAVSTATETRAKVIFLKVKAGLHRIRLMPFGNKLDRLPYLRVVQHTTQEFKEGKSVTNFAMCWSALYENVLSKKTDEERKNNTMIGYLRKQNKLTDADIKLYQDYGCPFCKAFAAMDNHGVYKPVRNKLLKKEQFLWNVFWRQTLNSGDNKIYVYSSSKTIFNKIINSIKFYKDAGINVMSLDHGHDFALQATGEGFGGAGQGRRYDIQPVPTSEPVNIGQEVSYDLAEIASNGFKSYADVCQMLKNFGSNVLESIGYVIPGFNPMANNGQGVSSPAQVIVEPTIPMNKVAEVATQLSNLSKAEVVEVGGTLYEKQPDGSLKPLF